MRFDNPQDAKNYAAQQEDFIQIFPEGAGPLCFLVTKKDAERVIDMVFKEYPAVKMVATEK